ncbi:MAG TPA: hypothetical protein VEX69_09820 [Candidatus Limnocylindria bacterium]|nr:hypothetical protein [Candidatus Limnocylindria bacterium]
MNCEPIHDWELPKSKPSKKVLGRLASVLLLLVVAGYTTHAKTCWYCAPSNPVHYLSIASKATVVNASADIDHHQVLEPVIRLVPMPPVIDGHRRYENEILLIQRISITVSLQHRSPPTSLA